VGVVSKNHQAESVSTCVLKIARLFIKLAEPFLLCLSSPKTRFFYTPLSPLEVRVLAPKDALLRRDTAPL
jgi:hypothetical protein